MARQDKIETGKRAGGAGHVFAVIGKVVGTIFLTVFLTALIFACLFAVYVKNDLSQQAQWASDSFSMEQTSVIYYEDPDTGKYEVLQAIYGGSNSTFVEYDDIPKNLMVPLDSYSSDKSYTLSPALCLKVSSVFVIFPFLSISAFASLSIGAF